MVVLLNAAVCAAAAAAAAAVADDLLMLRVPGVLLLNRYRDRVVLVPHPAGPDLPAVAGGKLHVKGPVGDRLRVPLSRRPGAQMHGVPSSSTARYHVKFPEAVARLVHRHTCRGNE